MKRRFTFLLCCVPVLAAVVVAATHQAGSQPALDQRIARIESHLLPGIIVKGAPLQNTSIAERMRVFNTPGVSVAVVNGGVIEWARGYGVQEAGGTVPVTAHTRFQAASISKPVAAMAALRLVQDGRLPLDEDVNAKLTSWKVPGNDFTKQQPVTLRRLLSHSAGLTVHGFPGYASDAPLPTLVQILDGAKPANTAPIRVDILPGSEWRYSGGGYTVVQQMLVDVTGRPFPQFMRDTVLQALGMSDSTYEQPLPDGLRAQAASGHRADGKVVEGRYHTYPEMAAAGLWTTPGDLARFAIALQQAIAGKSNTVLSPATAREMLTLQKGSYGLGLSLSGAGGSARFGHGGSNEGFRCEMVAYMETGQGAVVMTNSDRGGRVGQELLRAIASEYGWPDYPGPREKTLAQVDPATFPSLAGRYEIGPGNTVTIEAAGNKLLLVAGTQRLELLPESATTFFEITQEIDIEFVTGPDGAVSHLLVNGQTKARRLPRRP
jgi:CubicO group peptidase (beta-lactamase class C family)